MSESRDKRRRADLELFVLALIQGGIATPYDLHRLAGLSPGATIPVLQRLVSANHLKTGKPGARGRIEYRLTRSGTKKLAAEWPKLIEAGPIGDRDADLRVALLALWVGGDRRAAVEFLKLSASNKLEMVEAAKGETSTAKAASLAMWYRELRSLSSVALAKSEVEVIRSMADALPKLPAARHTNQP